MPDLDDYEQTEEVSENELDAWVKPGGKRVFVNRHPDNIAHAERLKWIRESELDKLKAAKEGDKEAPKKDAKKSPEEIAIRAEYLKHVGKEAHYMMGKDKMLAHIAKAKAGGE